MTLEHGPPRPLELEHGPPRPQEHVPLAVAVVSCHTGSHLLDAVVFASSSCQALVGRSLRSLTTAGTRMDESRCPRPKNKALDSMISLLAIGVIAKRSWHMNDPQIDKAFASESYLCLPRPHLSNPPHTDRVLFGSASL